MRREMMMVVGIPLAFFAVIGVVIMLVTRSYESPATKRTRAVGQARAYLAQMYPGTTARLVCAGYTDSNGRVPCDALVDGRTVGLACDDDGDGCVARLGAEPPPAAVNVPVVVPVNTGGR